MVTKEKIREGIDNILFGGHAPLIPGYTPKVIRNQILSYLHSQGVVLKVEDWLPTHSGMVCTVDPLIETDVSGIILGSLDTGGQNERDIH